MRVPCGHGDPINDEGLKGVFRSVPCEKLGMDQVGEKPCAFDHPRTRPRKSLNFIHLSILLYGYKHPAWVPFASLMPQRGWPNGRLKFQDGGS